MSVASKLQIKPGQSVAVINGPPGVDLELGADSPTADDPGAAVSLLRRCDPRPVGETADRHHERLASALRFGLPLRVDIPSPAHVGVAHVRLPVRRPGVGGPDERCEQQDGDEETHPSILMSVSP